MSHLIQAIDIEGTKHCVKHGATTPKWRTLSFLANMVLSGAEDADQWVEEGGGVEFEGLVTYGTCCLWNATVRFLLGSDGADYYGRIYLNGILADGFERMGGSTGESIDIIVDLNAYGLMGRACGNLWEIEAIYTNGTAAAVSVQVIDVTFGPPV